MCVEPITGIRTLPILGAFSGKVTLANRQLGAKTQIRNAAIYQQLPDMRKAYTSPFWNSVLRKLSVKRGS